jgi:hypothetical protein
VGNIAAIVASLGGPRTVQAPDLTGYSGTMTSGRPTCTQLCSNHCCMGTAVDLTPRHLCARCKADPTLNGPEPVFVEKRSNQEE